MISRDEGEIMFKQINKERDILRSNNMSVMGWEVYQIGEKKF